MAKQTKNKITFNDINVGDEFFMVAESSFIPYKLLHKSLLLAYCEKPSGKKDYYKIDTEIKLKNE